MPRLSALLLVIAAVPATAQDNVLVLLTDDMGVDIVGCYREGPVPAPTPNMDALAQGGLLFRSAWASPICSPTRAHLQTGRYGFRTGLGTLVVPYGWALSPSERILPEALRRYSPLPYGDAYFGKWHLGNASVGGPRAPNLAGWTHFEGTEGNLTKTQTYDDWVHVDDGYLSQVSDYATTRTVDDFLAWMESTPEPWVAVVAFHAPHDPLHAPPSHLHSFALPDVDPRTRPRLFYRAMVEALDTEIGRLLAGLGDRRPRTNVILMADNGTPNLASVPPFLSTHAKLTPYEGGVNVPLIINGPAVKQPGCEVNALVHSTDIFATALDLAGVDQDRLHASELIDGISLVPYLADPSLPALRRFVFSELFVPNGAKQTSEIRVLRNARYKVIRRRASGAFAWEFYDLALDPFETNDLMGSFLTPMEAASLTRLQRELTRILGS